MILSTTILVLTALGAAAPQQKEDPLGLTLSKPGAFEGYTLLCPLKDTSTYLLDMQGQVVHAWASDMGPGNSVYLLDNGHLLRAARMEDNPTFHGGGEGGRIREYDWDGKLLWQFDWNDKDKLHHHDFEPLPNGNLLLIAWEFKSDKQALARGKNPELMGKEGFWPDYLVEIEPQYPRGGKVVWEWHVWDHLLQFHDRELAGYQHPAANPGRVDINAERVVHSMSAAERARLEALGYLSPGKDTGTTQASKGSSDWMHTNGIDYNAELDQIVISVRRLNEMWVIDHSTTSAEARGESGGRSGRGGAILYRWGNPQTYRSGGPTTQQLFGQHDAQWVEPGLPGAGNLIVFDNGSSRPEGKYSRVLEVTPPLGKDGRYEREEGDPFLPAEAGWSYTAPTKEDFYSSFISGVQRLPNGNTLICEGAAGRVFEVTAAGNIVWEYWNAFGEPFVGGSRRPQPSGPPKGPPTGAPAAPAGGRGGVRPKALFRATRIVPDHPGLAGRKLEALTPQPTGPQPPAASTEGG